MSWTHLGDATPRAMKRYRCTGCWEFIEKGEQHLHRTGVMDGEMSDARWHFECEEYAFSDGNDIWDSSPGSFTRKEAREHAETCTVLTPPCPAGREAQRVPERPKKKAAEALRKRDR